MNFPIILFVQNYAQNTQLHLDNLTPVSDSNSTSTLMLTKIKLS